MSNFPGDDVCVPGCGRGLSGWSQRRVDGADVVYLAGDLDVVTAAEMRQWLMRVAESSTAEMIVVDLSAVHFIDACSVRVIVEARKAATCRGRRLRVDGLHGIPARIFEVLGLEPLLGRRVQASDGGRGCG